LGEVRAVRQIAAPSRPCHRGRLANRRQRFAEERWPMSPALRPAREIMEKLDPKPEPKPLPTKGKRVEPSWHWRGSGGVEAAGAEKCKGATGSLAIIVSGHGPLAPPQHRPRIAIADDFPRGAARGFRDTTPDRALCKPHRKAPPSPAGRCHLLSRRTSKSTSPLPHREQTSRSAHSNRGSPAP
jgi:hypothetical protein